MRALTALALVGIAVVHLRIAQSYTSIGKHPVSIGDQFYAQAVIAFVLAAVVVFRGDALAFGAGALFALGSLAVLVYSRFHALPVYGLSGGFQETWDVSGAKPAAFFEGAALALSLLGGGIAVAARDR